MFALFLITAFVILIYLMYPVLLMFQPGNFCKELENRNLDNVTVIYLSQNGENTLHEKIDFLLNELSDFKNGELIIVDDKSTDKSASILNQLKDRNLRIFFKKEPKGIPHSMNMGVKKARYNNIVFCDQRQCLTNGIIKRLINPLKYSKTGAVSACISNNDKMNSFSLLRAHENLIKHLEGKTGNLIGVYGPLYAIKRECYTEIPENIILDDLYLTLNILHKSQVLFLNECKIFDDNPSILYSYKRTKSYLSGFLQILNDKKLLYQLTGKQKFMLFWHKYLRLLIPLLSVLCYIMAGAKSLESTGYLITFSIISLSIVVSIFPINLKIRQQLKSILLINFFYAFAFFEIFVIELFFKKERESTKKIIL